LFQTGTRTVHRGDVIGIIAAACFICGLTRRSGPKCRKNIRLDLKHWFASLLFSLALNQLFLLFAPFDWLMRLFKNRWVARA
jgi:hypothetical protein